MGYKALGLLILFLSSAFGHQVTLNWQDGDPVTFKVYRAGCKTCTKTLKASGLLSPTYVDVTVKAGKTYFYWVTAVDANGTESAYSNYAKAIIPNP